MASLRSAFGLDSLRPKLGVLAASALPLAFILLLLAGSWLRWLDTYEYATYDWRFRLKPGPPVSDKIAIIEIWDDTLEQLGRWPIDRGFHAYLTQALDASGARMVGYDILFAEPGEGDSELAAAAKSFGSAYYSEVFSASHRENGRQVADKIQAPLLDVFRASAKGIGHVNAVIDEDGKRRRILPLITSKDGTSLWQLGIRMAADYLGVPPEKMGYDARGRLKIGDRVLPLDDEGQLIVNFAGKWKDTYTRLSYVDIIKSYQQMEQGEKPRLDLSVLKGKVCFVGLTAVGTQDINPIPIEVAYPQVGVHADVFNMILNRKFIVRLGRTANLLILIALCAAAAALARVTKLTVSVSAYLAALALFVLSAVLLFAFFLIWADLFYPALASGIVYLSGMVRRTLAEKKKRELIEAELVIASNIQKSFLPSSLPVFPALDLAVFMRPAKQVGGDLYTMFKIDDHRLGLMVGDVSGKGTPAALFMAKAVSEFKFHARGVYDPALALAALNDSLASEESGGLFVTMAYAVFDTERRLVRISSGGHLPVLRIRRDGSSDFLNPEGGMPLALMPGVEFGNLEASFEPGDIFIFYSDGIQEAKNHRRQDFDLERLAASAAKARELPAEGIEKKVLEDIERFVRGAPQHDDMTFIAVKVSGPA